MLNRSSMDATGTGHGDGGMRDAPGQCHCLRVVVSYGIVPGILRRLAMTSDYSGLDALFEIKIKRLEEAGDPDGLIPGLQDAREEIQRCERGDYDDPPVYV